MRVLDLFCGAGGVSMGLHQALPNAEIIGVDITHQPRYPWLFEPFSFVLADALTFPLDGFDFIWASPPCQHYIRGGLQNKAKTVHLVGAVRSRLVEWGGPWIIENVPGSPLRVDVLLCGSMFGQRIRRHRVFESSFTLPPPPDRCRHDLPITGVYGHAHGKAGPWVGKKAMLPSDRETWTREMGIDWMTADELTQAIPPSYARYLGRAIPGVTAL